MSIASMWLGHCLFTEAEMAATEAAGASPAYRANAEAMNEAFRQGVKAMREAIRTQYPR